MMRATNGWVWMMFSQENGDGSIWKIQRKMAAMFKKERKRNKGEEDDEQYAQKMTKLPFS